jgi:hypothetical protein
MPKLGQEKLVELKLPSSTDDDPAVVTVNTAIDAGQAEVLENSDQRSDAVFELLASLIKSWNFLGDDGKTAPITTANLRRLDVVDFKTITEAIFDRIKLELEVSPVPAAEKKG